MLDLLCTLLLLPSCKQPRDKKTNNKCLSIDKWGRLTWHILHVLLVIKVLDETKSIQSSESIRSLSDKTMLRQAGVTSNILTLTSEHNAYNNEKIIHWQQQTVNQTSTLLLHHTHIIIQIHYWLLTRQS